MAKRTSEFNDSIVTTEDSIKPGQLFSIKVEEVDQIWDGNLRIGLTILPDGILFPLARYSIPDMCDRGGSWICAIDNEVEMEKNSQRDLQSSFRFQTYQQIDGCNLNAQISQKCKCCLTTSFGSVPIYQLMSECFTNNCGKCVSHEPGKVGSIISIYYDVVYINQNAFHDDICVLEVPDCKGSNSSLSEPNYPNLLIADKLFFKYTFHVLVNGLQVNVHEDLVCIIPPRMGSFLSTNPYNYLPSVRGIVDVYGSTKSVQIVTYEQNKVQFLQDMCFHEMIKNCGYDHINQLPKSLKSYLQTQLYKLLHLKD